MTGSDMKAMFDDCSDGRVQYAIRTIHFVGQGVYKSSCFYNLWESEKSLGAFSSNITHICRQDQQEQEASIWMK